MSEIYFGWVTDLELSPKKTKNLQNTAGAKHSGALPVASRNNLHKTDGAAIASPSQWGYVALPEMSLRHNTLKSAG